MSAETASNAFRHALVITRRELYPLHGGGLMYSAQWVQLLADVAGRVTVLAQDHAGLTDIETRLADTFPANVAFTLTPVYHPGALHQLLGGGVRRGRAVDREALDRLLAEEPDLVVLDHLDTCWALDAVQAYRARQPSARVLYITHNMECDLLRAKALYCARRVQPEALTGAWRWRRALAAERRAVDCADLVSCITAHDAARYAEEFGASNSVVIAPVYTGPVVEERTIDTGVPRRVCMIGSLEWKLKIENTRVMLAALAAPLHAAGIELVIAGRMSDDLQQRLARNWPTVTVTANHDDVYGLMATCRAGLVVEPLGGGFKLKALDYLFARLPLFALRGSIEGIALTDSDNAVLREDLAALGDALIATMDDFAQLNAMHEEGYRTAQAFLPRPERATKLLEALRRPQAAAQGAAA